MSWFSSGSTSNDGKFELEGCETPTTSAEFHDLAKRTFDSMLSLVEDGMDAACLFTFRGGLCYWVYMAVGFSTRTSHRNSNIMTVKPSVGFFPPCNSFQDPVCDIFEPVLMRIYF
jgi:hypothetical protein